jgi:hypothetical protein
MLEGELATNVLLMLGCYLCFCGHFCLWQFGQVPEYFLKDGAKVFAHNDRQSPVHNSFLHFSDISDSCCCAVHFGHFSSDALFPVQECQQETEGSV